MSPNPADSERRGFYLGGSVLPTLSLSSNPSSIYGIHDGRVAQAGCWKGRMVMRSGAGESKRWKAWLISGALTLAFSGILLRLYWIQMVAVHSFSGEEADLIAQAEAQQSRMYVADSGRGPILDRQGKSLTGEKAWRLVVFPLSESQWSAYTDPLKQVADLIGYSFSEFREQVENLDQPRALPDKKGEGPTLTEEQAQAIRQLDIPGVYALQGDHRYDGGRLAQQLIGRVERNPFLVREKYPEEWDAGYYSSHSRIGVTGLEAAFEPFLRGGAQQWLTYTTDGRGQPLNGLNMTTAESGDAIPYRIQSTMDRRAQQVAEKALDEAGVTDGAVVVQEISTGDVLAMASKPDMDTARKGENPWDNRALMETTPGSIFKTVVAVAALDSGKVKPTETFTCKGHLGRYGMKDSKEGGHGRQTLSQAYANSCNVVFSKVAERLGGKMIEEYARRMGLGQRILWSGKVFKGDGFRQLSGEQTGMIFSEKTAHKDLGAVVQTAIGQRDVRMTPLQATNMVTTLFHEGKTMNPRVVREIQYHDGKPYFRFSLHALKTDRKISPEALRAVREMMRGTVLQGTASDLKGATVSMGAKTGTAQLGLNKDRYNKWMVGYSSYEKPRYAVAVLIRSVKNGNDRRAHQVFRQVMEGLAEELEGKKKG